MPMTERDAAIAKAIALADSLGGEDADTIMRLVDFSPPPVSGEVGELVERLLTDAAYAKERVGATIRQIGRDCAEAASALTAAEAERDRLARELEEAREATDQWRNLALQFDGHRIEALSLLRCIVESIEKFATVRDIMREPLTALKSFLARPPLSGEAVLAERIAALASGEVS